MTIKKIWSSEQIGRAAFGGSASTGTMSRRSALKVAAAAAGVAAVGPFIGSSPARAEVGGQLEVMAWEGFDLTTQLESWREANGVTQTVAAIGNQDDVQAKFIAGNPPPIDLAEYNQGYASLYGDDLKIIRPLDESLLPNYNPDDIFPGFYKTQSWYWNGQLYGIPWTWGLNSLVYNTSKMSKPTSFSELLAPELEGRIALVDDTLATWPVAANVAGFADKYPNLTKDEMAQVFDALRPYRDHARVIALTYGDVISMFVSGEIDAIFCGWSGLPVETIKQGVETNYSIPKEGATMWCDAWFTPISADNIDTAHAFINESIRPDVQASVAAAVTAGAVTKGAVDLMDDNTRALFDYNDLDSVFANAPLLGIPPRVSDKYATYSEWVDAWNEFKAG
jgi:spermidine/putrescine transport system substrate-binding protein